MKYKNETENKIKVRSTMNNGLHYWESVRPGDSIEIENRVYAENLGLSPVVEPVVVPVEKEEPKEEVKAEESELGEKKVETKKRSFRRKK